MKLSNKIYKTALHIAIKRGNIEILKLLMEHKDININAKYIVIA